MPVRNQPSLDTYITKRDPRQTPEPFGRLTIPVTNKLFVVQQHAASHLHFDLRLEVGGVLKSWAVPKGPSDDPSDKRLAMQTEDHPLDYADFEGEIPPGNYGAGHVIVWDRGTYTPLELQARNFDEAYKKGKLLFEVAGFKMRGRWTLVRIKTKTNKDGRDNTGKEWLLIKEQDQYAVNQGCTFNHTSVLSGLTVEQLKNPAGTKRSIRKKLTTLPTAKQGHPKKPKPMLAKAGDAHNRRGWIWELKYDGYRILAARNEGIVRLVTRNGLEISERFPEICQTLAHLPMADFVMDGELIINDATGRPSFANMQTRARSMTQHQVSVAAIEQPATYYAFDLLHLEGQDLRACPLLDRKAVLRSLVPAQGALRFSEHFADQGQQTYQAAQELGLEGVVGKRQNSRYTTGRSADWIKVRNARSDEFVVVGWSPSKGQKHDIGSLALAEFRTDHYVYVGHAGSGLNISLRETLRHSFKSLARKTPPIKSPPEGLKTTHWVRPKLVIEVSFTEYTPAGHLRHPSIQRQRFDKAPQDCIGRFIPTPDKKASLTSSQPRVQTTNPEKVFFEKPGFTKGDLVEYYRAISPWVLPYLKDRPIVLTRFPDGESGKSFYQRDVPDYVPDWIRREVLWSESTDKPVNYFVLDVEEDLAYVANMGTLPIHMWHSRVQTLDHADWCVLDLDPKVAPFSHVITLAKAIKDLADELELPAMVKTSGATGLHILIPLDQQLTHEQSRTLGELLATVITDRYPDIATIARSVRSRQNKVYIDFMQNGHGRLIAAPFCVRATPEASVSMPLRWHEVKSGLSNTKFHIGNAIRRMQRMKNDPFREVLTTSPDLTRSLSLLAELQKIGQ
ncbi:MAG: DNA ligase D [Pseudomonadota bacterium]